MLDAGEQVTTPDGHSGRIVVAVSHMAADALAGIDENEVVVRSVLLPGGEVRWYADHTLKPLTWAAPPPSDADEALEIPAGTSGAKRLP